MINLSSLLKKAHLFRCARTTRSNVAKTGVLEWWSNGVMHLPVSAVRCRGPWWRMTQLTLKAFISLER